MKSHKEFDEGDYAKMASNPNPPLETRKPLFALEYSKMMKELGYGKKTLNTTRNYEATESDSKRS